MGSLPAGARSWPSDPPDRAHTPWNFPSLITRGGSARDFRSFRSRPGSLGDRDLEPIRVLGREAVGVPVVSGLFNNGAAEFSEAGGDRVHILCRVAPDAESLAFATVAALGEVILGEAELAAPRFEHHALKPAPVLP